MSKKSVFDLDPEQLNQLLSISKEAIEPASEEQSSSPDVEPQAAPTASLNVVMEKPGSRIGNYKLLAILGEGGMGIVYLAEQEQPMRRQVALKVIKPGMDSRRVIARFEAERQALALLDHPNIAHVHDAGMTKAGRPYFVMEHVKGFTITEHCDCHKLTIEDRLDLFLQVCHAIHHAHQKGIIHRDVKPSNILIQTQDDQAIPKIIDFGVAKAISQPLTEKTLFTEQGQLFGTPEYMSPEQAHMANEDIDTRSDIYSLGVLLYVLLTGAHPFDARGLREGGIDHIRQVIRETDPRTPSTRLSSLGEEAREIAESRRIEVTALTKRLHKELEWIPLKAMRKDRSERYRSASELADDVENYLNGTPLLAGPPGTLYRLGKFVRRNRTLVSGIAAVLLVLTIGVVGITIFAIKAERRRAETQLVSNSFLESVRNSLDPYYVGDKITVRSVLDSISGDLEKKFKGLPLAEAEIRHALSRAYWSHGLYEQSELHAERVLEIHRTHHGPKHPMMVGYKKHLAWVYFYNSRYVDAEPLFLEAWKDLQRVLGEEDGRTLHAMASLGALYFVQGRFAEAEQLSGKAFTIMQGKENPAIEYLVDHMWMLGAGYRLQGRYAQAESLIQKALEISRREYKEQSWRTLHLRNGLGELCRDLGRYEEAAQHLGEALAGRRKIWGEHHPDTLFTLGSLGWLHYSRGRYEQAETLLSEALEAARRVVGNSHIICTQSMHGLGTLYLSQGRHDKAEPLLKEALDIANDLQGEKNWHALHVMSTLAKLYTAQGRLVEAEKQYLETLAAQRRVLGNEHPHTLASINDLAVLYTRQKRYDKAATLFKEALEGRQRKLGDDHPHTLETKNDIGILYLEQDLYRDAEPLLLRAYEGRKVKLGPEHPHALDSLKHLIGLYEAWGKPDEAKRWQAKLSPENNEEE